MIFRSAGLLLLMGTVGIAALLLNGGYVYKTSCPLASGGTQTTWTYGIDDILPYIRHTSEPCTAHTGTRLVLSAIGIAPLGNHGAEARADARSGLAKITADQKELQALDGRMEAFRREEGRPVSDAEALADDYHKLLDKARGQQPSSAKGDEAEVWRSLIGLMALHAQAADIVVRAARRGDF